jgi:hypothetical protein
VVPLASAVILTVSIRVMQRRRSQPWKAPVSIR